MLTMRKTDDAAMTPGAWLKAAREDARLTQEEVGRALQVTGATVSSWEHGRIKRIDEQYIDDLARLLGKSPTETARGLGKLVSPDAPDDAPPLSALAALRADKTLLPELREHITRQYLILQKLTEATRALDPDEVESRRLMAEHRKATGTSPERKTPKRRR